MFVTLIAYAFILQTAYIDEYKDSIFSSDASLSSDISVSLDLTPTNILAYPSF